ncbi:hypothetical protein YC2023_022532 [Brassica napus]
MAIEMFKRKVKDKETRLNHYFHSDNLQWSYPSRHEYSSRMDSTEALVYQ